MPPKWTAEGEKLVVVVTFQSGAVGNRRRQRRLPPPLHIINAIYCNGLGEWAATHSSRLVCQRLTPGHLVACFAR